jgi:hypothetical protein
MRSTLLVFTSNLFRYDEFVFKGGSFNIGAKKREPNLTDMRDFRLGIVKLQFHFFSEERFHFPLNLFSEVKRASHTNHKVVCISNVRDTLRALIVHVPGGCMPHLHTELAPSSNISRVELLLYSTMKLVPCWVLFTRVFLVVFHLQTAHKLI